MSLEYAARNYSGVAPETTLVGTIGTGDTAWTLADGTGYPTANFPIVIDYDNGSLEKCYVGTRSGTSLTGVLRAQDGTTAKSHSSGAKIRHVGFAEDFIEANAMAAALNTKGDVLVKGATATAPPSRLAVGATNGQVLTVDSAQTLGLKYTTLGVIPVYTSTANRDAAIPSPSAGQVVYLDTGDRLEGLYVHNGTSWRQSSWNEPWGLVANPASSTSDQTGISTSLTDVTFATLSWTGVANRLYEIVFTARFAQVTSTGTQSCQIQTGASGAGTQLMEVTSLSTPAGSLGVSNAVAFHTGSGALSAHVRALTSAGTITVQNATAKGWFTVRDVGPLTGAPA